VKSEKRVEKRHGIEKNGPEKRKKGRASSQPMMLEEQNLSFRANTNKEGREKKLFGKHKKKRVESVSSPWGRKKKKEDFARAK